VGEFMPGKLVQAKEMPNRETAQQEKKKCLFF
jgi:hypothetical protein